MLSVRLRRLSTGGNDGNGRPVFARRSLKADSTFGDGTGRVSRTADIATDASSEGVVAQVELDVHQARRILEEIASAALLAELRRTLLGHRGALRQAAS
jgi:hypothetical protein